jgi:UDP:flavonoid glycosyltransferase YjiC (YdhE family)
VDAVRVHYFVHGHGRGHASRTLPIVAALRAAGHSVRIHAGDDAMALFADEPGLVEILSLRPEANLGVAVASTLSGMGRRVAQARAVFRRDPPQLVISDGDAPGMFAARLAQVPSVAVGHGLVFSHCVAPPGVSPAAWAREGLKGHVASWSAGARVAVNFVPLGTRRSSTRVARPTPRFGLTRSPRPGDDVLCYFSEGDGTRVVAGLRMLGLPVRVFVGPRARVEGVETEPIDASTFAAALAGARAVVATAGSQLIAECLALGIPMFALALPRHREQELNVQMLCSAGLGRGDHLDRVRLPALQAFVDGIDRLAPCLARQADLPTADVAVVDAVGAL